MRNRFQVMFSLSMNVCHDLHTSLHLVRFLLSNSSKICWPMWGNLSHSSSIFENFNSLGASLFWNNERASAQLLLVSVEGRVGKKRRTMHELYCPYGYAIECFPTSPTPLKDRWNEGARGAITLPYFAGMSTLFQSVRRLCQPYYNSLPPPEFQTVLWPCLWYICSCKHYDIASCHGPTGTLVLFLLKLLIIDYR